jgi:hypothetical protein
MESGYEGVVLVAAVAWIGLYVWTVVVCFQKGKSGFGMLGIAAVIIPFVGWLPFIGAMRLAKPSSPWARKRYGPDKVARAWARFPNDAPPVAVSAPTSYVTVAAPAAPVSPPQMVSPPPPPSSQTPASWRQSPPPGWTHVPSTPRRQLGPWAPFLFAAACLAVGALIVLGMTINNEPASQAAAATQASAPTTSAPVTSAPEDVDVVTFSGWVLDVGDCFDEPASFEGVVSMPAKSCGFTHDNEVYAHFDLPGGPFPGEGTIAEFADAECYERFEAYVGRPYETSRLEVGWYAPTAESWSMERDRAVTCFVYDMNLELLVGSARRSGW